MAQANKEAESGIEVKPPAPVQESASSENKTAVEKPLAWYRFDGVRSAQGFNLVRFRACLRLWSKMWLSYYIPRARFFVCCDCVDLDMALWPFPIFSCRLRSSTWHRNKQAA